MMVRNLILIKHRLFENIVLLKCFHSIGECCTRVEVYYKNKTKAYERRPEIYGSYTRVIGDDVKGRYYYQSNFANGYYGIWFCGRTWFIGKDSDKGRCQGWAKSNFNADKCVHDIGFDWKYYDGSVWANGEDGLSVKCLYEPGNCRYSFKINSFHTKNIPKIKIH